MSKKQTSDKKLKTPLRYPGGKSRAIKTLDAYLPDNMDGITEYRELFLGGGSLAIHITKKYSHLKVHVNELHHPLYNFWIHLRDNGPKLHEMIIELKENYEDPLYESTGKPYRIEMVDGKPKKRHPNHRKAKSLFIMAKTHLLQNRKNNGILEAAYFYVTNKCSFSGLGESSSFSALASISNFSREGINRLPGYSKIIKDWVITNHSYEKLLDDKEGVLYYLDPPYDIKDNLYGQNGDMHKGFNHDDFATDCQQIKESSVLVSYNSANLVKNRFNTAGWHKYDFDLTYTMRSTGTYGKDQKKRKELLLLNYKILNPGE